MCRCWKARVRVLLRPLGSLGCWVLLSAESGEFRQPLRLSNPANKVGQRTRVSLWLFLVLSYVYLGIRRRLPGSRRVQCLGLMRRSHKSRIPLRSRRDCQESAEVSGHNSGNSSSLAISCVAVLTVLWEQPARSVESNLHRMGVGYPSVNNGYG